MSEPKFTPGPWCTEPRQHTIRIAGGHRIGSVPIAEIEIGYVIQFDAENRANANLIAAAPQLYAACEEAITILGAIAIAVRSDHPTAADAATAFSVELTAAIAAAHAYLSESMRARNTRRYKRARRAQLYIAVASISAAIAIVVVAVT